MYLGKQDQCHKHLCPTENKSLESGNGRADYRIKKLSQIFLFLKYFFGTAVMPQRELCECDLRLSQMTMERQGCSLEGCGAPQWSTDPPTARRKGQSWPWLGTPEKSFSLVVFEWRHRNLIQGKIYPLWDTSKSFSGGRRKPQQSSQTKSNKRQRPSNRYRFIYKKGINSQLNG